MCTSVLLAGCGQAKAGTALPRGEDAAAYVSAKFESTLEKLSDKMSTHDAVKTTVKTRFLISGQGIDATTTTAQTGKQDASILHNASNTDLNDRIDYLHPAGGPVDYVLLGPAYSSLAPTPWVSEPHLPGDFGACVSSGTYHTACKMLNAVVTTTKKNQAVKYAKQLTDGSVTLQADITLQTFLDTKVVDIDQGDINKMTAQMLQQPLHTTITIDPQGKLRGIDMAAKFDSKTKTGKDISFDINYNFQITGVATPADIPQAPDAGQVTVLPDQTAVDDFNARKDKIQRG
jgi:hypothetical protein